MPETVKRTTPEHRRRAREARAVEGAPAPKQITGSLVEITGAAKVHLDDPIAGHVETDHQGAVGSLESTYYNPERQEHMGRVRVGQAADGSGGQLRGIPLERLEGVASKHTRPAASATATKTRVGPLNISQERWDDIFGKKDD